ncbi:MAG: rRNA maturation RNase YbeY [candidate division KSB1 bacterium]|nr:rRNA maturation RNase YbeY [candidate division KSB1 bacterium]MDZ7284097.1 rRNA maturation RNase YbeY [candidate division KSB1 bacterium]MDZ7348372.1 rRNA maturation RNase YbeY [candidate division KSB1 bacterium]MDZ7354201.1 rRNA maturation RNase YbeY [candidate division KSB1 bacterium]MDZ7415305.1 rRNA maturation RNase YbeY [candidate division KSB1 bacterium]
MKLRGIRPAAKSRGAIEPELLVLLQQLWQRHGAPAAEVEVQFVDEAMICRLHEQFLQDPSPTDIITFDLGVTPAGTRLAQLCLCPAVAARHARRFRTTLRHELHRLIVHGILHLLGYDDHDPAGRRRMRERERIVLRQLAI